MSHRVLRLVLGLVILVVFMAPAQPRAVAGTTVRVRIGVITDGIVQITAADLAAAGVDPATLDPRTFAMASMGQPIALRVTGEADGRFDSEDRIIFFGQKFRGTEFQEKYTDERVYWLDIGGTAGPRIADVDATPLGDLTPPQDVAATVHAEADTIWIPLYTLSLVNITQDTLFWTRLRPTAMRPVTATLDYVIPDPAPDTAAQFSAMVYTRYSNAAAQPEHHNKVTLNNRHLLDETWAGQWLHELTADVPAGTLVSGTNSVQISAQVMPGNYTDDILVNYWDVTYRRLFRAWQGQFDFRAEAAGPHEYVVSNWASKFVALWDVTDPAQPLQLTGAIPVLAGPETQLRFRITDKPESRYWLQEEATFQSPATIRLHQDAGLRNLARGADTVIVTPAEFQPAAQRLAVWHEAHGRRAVVAILQDVYDEFNAGIQIAPEAIPNMLRWGSEHWTGPAPAYLTLVGDGHWNMKGIDPATYGTAPVYMPPYLAFADPWLGEVPVDVRYGDLNDDGLPDVAVGRLAANSLADANVIVDKIVNYDETFRAAVWQRRALFVADNDDPAGNFPALSEEIVTGYLPADLKVTRAYLPGSVPSIPATAEQIATTKKIISDTLQAGAWLMQFTGHGAPQFWASERLLTVTEVAGLNNGDRLPVIMSFNCLDGWFVDPKASYQALAEVQQRQPGGGAVAAIAPTGDGITSDQQMFRRILMTVMFQENVREIGQAVNLTKQRYLAQGGARYLAEIVTLFGDPAMLLPLPNTSPTSTAIYLPAMLR
jgi:hypothetical protein